MGSYGKQNKNNKRGLCGLRHIARKIQKKIAKTEQRVQRAAADGLLKHEQTITNIFSA